MKCSNCNFEQEKDFKYCPECAASAPGVEDAREKRTKAIEDKIDAIDKRTKDAEEKEKAREKEREDKRKSRNNRGILGIF